METSAYVVIYLIFTLILNGTFMLSDLTFRKYLGEHVCLECKHHGLIKQSHRVNPFRLLFLTFLGIVPGMVYFTLKAAQSSIICESCGSSNVIDSDDYIEDINEKLHEKV